ncbi:MAG: limonene-1,2-epoxide hydrolase family protein [Mycobacteriales bacterium]
MSNLDVVNQFLKVCAKRDYDAAFGLVTDDLEYQNMMLPPVQGKDAMRDTCDMLLSLCEDSEWLVHHEVANGDLVMNERTDRFLKDGAWHDLPVAGVFQLREGLISSWHDYFDLQTAMTALFPEGFPS